MGELRIITAMSYPPNLSPMRDEIKIAVGCKRAIASHRGLNMDAKKRIDDDAPSKINFRLLRITSSDSFLPALLPGHNRHGARLHPPRTSQDLRVSAAFDVEKKHYDHLLLLCVHSHARLVGKSSMPNIMTRYEDVHITFISLPCCPKFTSQKDVGRVPDVHYENVCVFFRISTGGNMELRHRAMLNPRSAY
jgi:hypothetical protein